jgi:hypothetical protein
MRMPNAMGTISRHITFTHHGTQKAAQAQGMARMSRISASLGR